METQKQIIWMGSTRKKIQQFPDKVKKQIGFALYLAQEGQKHDTAKPFKGIDGVFEIVSNYATDTYRALYATKIGNLIYVLHAFQKKSTTGIKTPKKEVDLIKQRFKQAQALETK